MLNHQVQLDKTRRQRFLLRQKNVQQPQPRTKNIFSVDTKHVLQDLEQLNKDKSILHTYQICGDQQFKAKFFQGKEQKLKNKQHHLQAINPQESNITSNIITKNQTFKDQSQKFTQTIHMNQFHRNSFLSQLNKTQINLINRQCQTLTKFKKTQQSWQKIDTYLKLQIPKSQTVTFGSVNKIYVHQNPDKLDVVNDMLPEYWRNSLRNNDKKLKSHLKGHKFNSVTAEEMLQTLKGTKKLQNSIPRIGLQRVRNKSFDSENMIVKATKVQNKEGQETMRQFHKKMYNTLQQSIRERSFRESNTNKLSNKSRPNSLTNKTMPIKHFQLMDQIQSLTAKEKKLYVFCRDLQSLDKIDNENYSKFYEKKHKWAHEALENGS